MLWVSVKWFALIVYAVVVLPILFIGACVGDAAQELWAARRHIWNQWAMEWGSLRSHLGVMYEWASERPRRLQKTEGSNT